MKGKKIFRCMPVLVALCVLLEGMFFMTITKPGHVPDIWTHVYRIDSILNGDVIARPVTSVYGQINVYSVTTKSERYERSYWTRTAAGNGIGGRKAPVPYGS